MNIPSVTFDVTGPGGSPLIVVPIFQQGNGSQGQSTQDGYPAGRYTVCEEVPAGFTGVPKRLDQQTVSGNCVSFHLGPNNTDLQLINVPLASPSPSPVPHPSPAPSPGVASLPNTGAGQPPLSGSGLWILVTLVMACLSGAVAVEWRHKGQRLYRRRR